MNKEINKWAKWMIDRYLEGYSKVDKSFINPGQEPPAWRTILSKDSGETTTYDFPICESPELTMMVLCVSYLKELEYDLRYYITIIDKLFDLDMDLYKERLEKNLLKDIRRCIKDLEGAR
jgi:hypothetical protein